MHVQVNSIIFLLTLIVVCYYSILKNMIILIYTINNKNICNNVKISKIREIVRYIPIPFFWGNAILFLFIISYFKFGYTILKILILIIIPIMLFLPYIFCNKLADFLTKKLQ